MKNLALKTIEVEGEVIPVEDSREVAEMMEINHKDLLKKIDSINKDFDSEKVRHEKYWIESTFESRGREYRNFQITKRGCEFLAHKTTGTKGNLFTDRYMDKFEYMEKQLSSGKHQLEKKPTSAIDLFEAQVKALREVEAKVEKVDKKVDKKFEELPLFPADVKNLKKIVNKVVVPLLGGKKSNAYKPLSKKVFSDLYGQVFREFGVDASSEINRKDFELAKEVVRNYKLPTALKNEIELLNNQSQLDI